MADNKISQHKHCLFCGKAFIGGNDRYCSQECKNTKKDDLKNSKSKLMKIWFVGAGLMVVAIILLLTLK